jgi:hypothetical protein
MRICFAKRFHNVMRSRSRADLDERQLSGLAKAIVPNEKGI